MLGKFSVACTYQLSPNLLPKLLEKILILTRRDKKIKTGQFLFANFYMMIQNTKCVFYSPVSFAEGVSAGFASV